MKILMIECNEAELKANRGIMDNIVDAMSYAFNGFYGTYAGACNNVDTDDDTDEETDTEECDNER